MPDTKSNQYDLVRNAFSNAEGFYNNQFSKFLKLTEAARQEICAQKFAEVVDKIDALYKKKHSEFNFQEAWSTKELPCQNRPVALPIVGGNQDRSTRLEIYRQIEVLKDFIEIVDSYLSQFGSFDTEKVRLLMPALFISDYLRQELKTNLKLAEESGFVISPEKRNLAAPGSTQGITANDLLFLSSEIKPEEIDFKYLKLINQLEQKEDALEFTILKELSEIKKVEGFEGFNIDEKDLLSWYCEGGKIVDALIQKLGSLRLFAHETKFGLSEKMEKDPDFMVTGGKVKYDCTEDQFKCLPKEEDAFVTEINFDINTGIIQLVFNQKFSKQEKQEASEELLSCLEKTLRNNEIADSENQIRTLVPR